MKEIGLRFNYGKIRYDLLPAQAMEKVAEVFTRGAEKYAERNWEKGMNWSNVTASLKRHLAAYEKGEDFDKETGLLHVAHLATNALFLLQYYSSCPQFDDRYTMQPPRIALDIDDVVADCVGYLEKTGQLKDPAYWLAKYDKLDFKPMDYEVKEYPPFTPVAYISHRNMVTKEQTASWIQEKGLPCAPIYIVKNREEKVALLKDLEVDIFVDDNAETFIECNKSGVFCYLMDMPHNRHINAGFKRITSLSEVWDVNKIFKNHEEG